MPFLCYVGALSNRQTQGGGFNSLIYYSLLIRVQILKLTVNF